MEVIEDVDFKQPKLILEASSLIENEMQNFGWYSSRSGVDGGGRGKEEVIILFLLLDNVNINFKEKKI